MALTKEQKTEIIEKLTKLLQEQKAMVFVKYSGIGTEQLSDLRNKLRQAGTQFMVTKKTLAKIAFEKQGMELPKEASQGELAIAFGGEDEVQPAKIIYDFSKQEENLEIMGGFLGQGKDIEFLDKEKVITLAEIPSQEELFARIAGALSAPIRNFVYVQQANIKGLISVLTNINTR